MVEVKGTAIAARIKYLNEKAAPPVQEEIIAKLRPEFQQEIKKGILISKWYSFDDYIELNRIMDKVLGRGDLSLIYEMARYSANQALHGIYRLFYKIGSPEFVIQRAAKVFNQYYSSGNLRAFIDRPKTVRLLIEDFENPAHEHCLAVMGWAHQVLELSGGKKINFAVARCRKKGAAVCELQGSWE